MPSHGDGSDAELRRNRRDGEPLQLVHHDDCASSRWQPVECTPYRCPRDYGGTVIGFGLKGRFVVVLLHRGSPPLVAAKIDQYTHQPGFLAVGTERHGFGRTGGAEERLLDQIESVVSCWSQPARQPVHALMVGVEQCGDAVGGSLLDGNRQRARDRLTAHTYLDARRDQNDWPPITTEPARVW